MSKPWFAPKHYGYGAGAPISWEGWVVFIALLGCIVGGTQVAIAFLPGAWKMAGVLAAVLLPCTIFLPIIRNHTEGGWRWRNGGQ